MTPLTERQLRFFFPYQQRIHARWSPKLEDTIRLFHKQMQRAKELDKQLENERIIDFLENVSLSNGKIVSIETEMPKTDMQKKERRKISITVEFAEPEDVEAFASEYEELIEEGKVL